jgi:hypothetical protein
MIICFRRKIRSAAARRHADLKVLKDKVGRRHEYCTEKVNQSERKILEASKEREKIPGEASRRKEEVEKSERQRREEVRKSKIEKELKEGRITPKQASRSIRSRPEDPSAEHINLVPLANVIKSLEDSHSRTMAYLMLEHDGNSTQLDKCEKGKKRLEDRDHEIGKLYACSDRVEP